jgi:hypothetical protein
MRRIIGSFAVIMLTVFAAPAFAAGVTAITPVDNACAPSSVEVCGEQIPIPQTVVYGAQLQVIVPPELLARAYKDTPVAVTALCDNVHGVPQYRTATPASCNMFLCQPATLSSCGDQVEISRTAELGESFKTSSPSGPLTVQCQNSSTIPQFVVTQSGCNE